MGADSIKAVHILWSSNSTQNSNMYIWAPRDRPLSGHSSTICKNPKLETTQMHIYGKTVK
jgi:hypothetical protein